MNTTVTVKEMRNSMNAARLADDHDYRKMSNRVEVMAYADMLMENGEQSLGELFKKAGEFLEVWHENEIVNCREQRDVDYANTCNVKSLKDRKGFIALDRGTSGVFLLEKETGFVWSIKGYGRKNRIINTIDHMIETYRQATADTVAKKAEIAARRAG